MKPLRRTRSGFTLIEILIAMTILMIGIVGILSLFPVGIKNVADSVEDSTAANLAQSLSGAMTEAMRRPDSAGEIRFVHDGINFVAASHYKFSLPTAVGVADIHPRPGEGTDGFVKTFRLGTAGITGKVLLDITQPPGPGGDPSEPLAQYSYQFEVSRPPESMIPLGAGALTPVPLYQFRFMIYRNFTDPSVAPGDVHPELVKEFTLLIAGAGL